MIKYDIRNEFEVLKEFAVKLPEKFDNIGSVILDNRNVVKKVTMPEGTFVVKDFKGMYFFNRLGYSLFSISKAERSHVNSKFLNEKGISTPPHVGWIDYYSWGLLKRSFFISVYQPHETVRELLKQHNNDKPVKISLYQHLVKFMLKLHRLGVYHDDFSLANILAEPTSDGYQFSLVDLNRVRFAKVSFRKGLHNFSKLDIPKDDLEKLISEYAIQAGRPANESVALFYADNRRILFLRNFRKKLKKYTLTPIEQFFKEVIPRFFQQRCNA
jgi:hypothetical protein